MLLWITDCCCCAAGVLVGDAVFGAEELACIVGLFGVVCAGELLPRGGWFELSMGAGAVLVLLILLPPGYAMMLSSSEGSANAFPDVSSSEFSGEDGSLDSSAAVSAGLSLPEAEV